MFYEITIMARTRKGLFGKSRSGQILVDLSFAGVFDRLCGHEQQSNKEGFRWQSHWNNRACQRALRSTEAARAW
jgi:hypothetical protein